MAVESNDLLVAYRPRESKHYKIEVGAVKAIPDGSEEGDTLIWTGSYWTTGKPDIDGGIY